MQILVVDDDSAARSLVERTLRSAGYEVRSANSGYQALEIVTGSPPGAVVLEPDLPDIDGADVCRQMRRVDRRMPILLISRHDTIGDRVRGLDAGGDSYLGKPFSSRELVARLDALVRRLEKRTAEIRHLTFAEIQLDASRYGVLVGACFEELTKTEYALLEMFMSSPGRLFSPTEIYDHVWGTGRSGTTSLRVYIGYVRRRLRDVGARPLIHTVAGSGYVMREPEFDTREGYPDALRSVDSC
jgi:two-component system, OmpR family, response regulator MprA